ncbi:AAA family ATPase [Deinococcus ruber]|uniref:Transcriptional regulator NadR n=1 Tax=Deinococcus ruber TaxID=1848197 RepID=A0A918F523_9DEIO|nr:AAA family ATPase [Deinococcus ruber]GGR08549.1 transcriptional regulator NadR [Deinococcus ruber]
MPEARFRHGLIVGKFAPLHAGHEYLIRTALAECERVSVWCYARPDFPEMPSPLRRGWLRQVFPAHLYPQLELLPDAPRPPLDSSPSEVHNAYVRGVLEGWNIHPDAVFTSEAYGEGFAAALGATHRLIDHERRHVPVSGTVIRADPHGQRRFLNPLVYAHFVRRVVILGAESTGKSTLTAALAQHFGTAGVREYGRDVYERENGLLSVDQFLEIALGQRALEQEALVSGQANHWLFCDTDAATTLMWSYLLCGAARPELHALADACRGRYAHTFVCDTGIEFEQDGWRSNKAVREVQQAHILQDLNTRSIAYTVLRGSVAERVAQVAAVLS